MDLSPEARDWASLPPELLHLVAGRLPLSVDYVRFRSVCPAWCAAAPPRRFPPLLMFPYHSPTRSIAFYDPCRGTVATVPVPSAEDAAFCGSSCGWIAFVDCHGNFFLLNPFTDARVPLPQVSRDLAAASGRVVSKIGRRFYCHAWDGSLHLLNLQGMRSVFIREVTLSASPGQGADCVVLATLTASTKAAFCRPGDASWTIVESGLQGVVQNAAYCSGRFYLADFVMVAMLDVGPPVHVQPMETLQIPRIFSDFRLLEWRGELLIISLLTTVSNWVQDFMETTESCLIFKWDLNGMPSWTRVESLRESTLFMSQYYSSCFTGSELVGCSRNSVYVSAPNPLNPYFWRNEVYHFRVVHLEKCANLENCVTEDVCCHWFSQPSDAISWLAPNLC